MPIWGKRSSLPGERRDSSHWMVWEELRAASADASPQIWEGSDNGSTKKHGEKERVKGKGEMIEVRERERKREK